MVFVWASGRKGRALAGEWDHLPTRSGFNQSPSPVVHLGLASELLIARVRVLWFLLVQGKMPLLNEVCLLDYHVLVFLVYPVNILSYFAIIMNSSLDHIGHSGPVVGTFGFLLLACVCMHICMYVCKRIYAY